ncbi:MAG: 3-isopropylmalate dehydrogenase [Anaerolineaceae bacterium]|nr:3-isopropylmalate dehydrogenase [Anaerolineaceae bacterium]
MNAKIVLLPGDGIGPEITAAAHQVLEFIAKRGSHRFEFSEYLIGGCSIDRYGVALTEETLEACKQSDAILLGAVGGPKWDNPAAPVRPEQGLLGLRKSLGLFANLRPVKIYPKLAGASPLRPERLAGVDMIIVRELTGGLYFGQPRGRFVTDGREKAIDTLEYHDYEIDRIVRMAFDLARGRRKKVTSVDKANVLESSRLWRAITVEIGKEYPDVTLEHALVDSVAMRLVANPSSFDVVVSENLFADILSDEAAILTGSLGVLPSASLGSSGPGMYEPIHGSAPDIAGKGIADPIGTIVSAAFLLRYSLKLGTEAAQIEAAVEKTIEDGCTTPDLGGSCSTAQVTEAILRNLQ